MRPQSVTDENEMNFKYSFVNYFSSHAGRWTRISFVTMVTHEQNVRDPQFGNSN